jgi:hypothetical protein
MTTKIIIPVVDTERGKFEYKGKALTSEEYGNMEYEHFRRTDRQVGRFADNLRRGISNFDPYSSRMRDVRDTNHPDIVFQDEEAEVVVKGGNRADMDNETLLSNAKTGKMFILILDINPDTLSLNAKSELRFWMSDSDKVINDNFLPDEVKLKSLLGRDYGIVVGEQVVKILNCKMVQNFSKGNHPFNFAIIVEKAYIE